jgi:DNA repair exonuclease SbcCD nuclease subunit
MIQRTRPVRNPDHILCSDFHLREDTPVCFTGDFMKEQWIAVDTVSDLQKKYNCTVLHAGDLFNHWKPSPWLITMAMRHLPAQFYTVYGQHDLPQHSLELVDKCGINVLKEAGRVEVLGEAHYGQFPVKGSLLFPETGETILVWHHLAYIALPFPGATGGNAVSILKEYPQYKLILTGDNHQPFQIGLDGRLLVNPGSLTRQKADQMDHKPRVYLWWAKENVVQPVFIPIQEGVITREHIEKIEERDKRIEAFVTQLDGSWDTKLSFEENLEQFRVANNVDPEIMKIIYKVIA